MKKLKVGEQDKSSSVYWSLTPCAGVSANPSLQPVAEKSDAATGPTEKTTVQEGLYPQLPSISPKMCPLHKQVLELYCCDDKKCVCEECSLREHKGHRVVHPDEEMEVIANILFFLYFIFIMFETSLSCVNHIFKKYPF